MRNLSSNFVLLAALSSASMSAVAGAGTITTMVTPLSDNVTYSTPGPTPPKLDTFIAYKITVANPGGNTINNIRFTGSATISTDLAEKAVFSSSEGASCTATNPDQTAIECTIGQLTAGEAFPTFAVFFKAPAKVTNGAADLNGEDFLTFEGTTYYAEGTGGPNSIPQNSTTPWSAALVELGTDNPALVKSAVPKAGTKLFTGSGGITTGADRFATTVDVPASTAFTRAEILESSFAPVCTNFNECFQTTLSIPFPVGVSAFSPYLKIVVRQDALNIKPGTKIGSVVIEYTTGTSGPTILGDCADQISPRTDFIPCIAKRVYYKNSRVPDWTVDLDGDFEWTLLNLANGTYRFP